MRISQLLGKSLRQTPAEAETISHQLLLRSGMIYQVATGVYSYLPLGWKSLRKLEQIIRDELDMAGGQELMMSVLQPLDLWETTGRDAAFGKSLFVLRDRKDHRLCLGPTHEEMITDIVGHNLQSYRDLPLLPYQIQTKFRDEPRSRGGLLRVREFTMMDLYSFDSDEESADISYRKMVQAYHNIYAACGLPIMMVEADSGAIGGKDSHEFMVITETGEDDIIHCAKCRYAANTEKAEATKPQLKAQKPLPMKEVATPDKESIEEVSLFLEVSPAQTLKAVFYCADGEVIFVAIRGDFEVNEVKLKNSLKCSELHMADEEEVSLAGLVPGFASPIGLSGIRIVADDSVTSGINFVAGANKPGYHIKNVNYPRDFQVDLMADIALAQPGQACPRCGGEMVFNRGIEVGHVFKLGTVFSTKLGASFLDAQGVQQPAIMGCYGIGVGRLLAAVIEHSHDEKGIIFPLSLAPYHVYLCALGMNEPETATAAEKFYSDLKSQGIEVLFDDRIESAGVKFNDADLLGIPLRVTLSRRTMKAESVEIKWRAEKQAELIPIAEATVKIKSLLNSASK